MNKKVIVQLAVFTVAALLLVPVLFSGVVRADGGDRETSVNVQNKGGYFSIDSQSTNTVGPKNEYNMVFTGNTFLMQFKNDSQTTGYSLQFSVQLENLTLVTSNGSIPLLNFSQQEFEVSSAPMTMNGMEVFALSTESDMARFIMTIQVVNAPVSASLPNGTDNSLLTPNEVEISFYILLSNQAEGGYQNMQMGAATHGGSIVLKLGLSAGNATVIGITNMNSYSQVEFLQGKNSGYFAWDNVANEGGKNVTVVSSLSSNGTLSLVYPYATTIIHDPAIGISPSTITSLVTSSIGNIVIYAVTLAVSAVLIGGAIAFRRRRQ